MIRGAVCSQNISLMRISTSLKNKTKQTNRKAFVTRWAWSWQLQGETTETSPSSRPAPKNSDSTDSLPLIMQDENIFMNWAFRLQAEQGTHLYTPSLRMSPGRCLSTPPVRLCSGIKELSPNSSIAWQGRLKRGHLSVWNTDTREHTVTFTNVPSWSLIQRRKSI